MPRRYRISNGLLLLCAAACAAPQSAEATAPNTNSANTRPFAAKATAWYKWLHQHPELSGAEKETSTYLTDTLRKLGYRVETGIGGFGVVAQLHNGPGRVFLLRTELDALPVLETTGLPYASRAVSHPSGGATGGPVMHACGHDLHMATWLATADYLMYHKEQWHGTLVLVGQPAEETLAGARSMFATGLMKLIPRPDLAFAIHDHDHLSAGTIGYTIGPYAASADSVSLVVFGRGGHGAYPQFTVDPIVLASRVVLALQTIVSRESDPLEPVVVSVGSIHGGSKSNVIPEEVRLELTVRTYSEASRARVLASIARIVEAEARAAGAPRVPEVHVEAGTAIATNAPGPTQELVAIFRSRWGEEQVAELPREMGSEDFGEFSHAGIPSVQLMIGAADPSAFAKAKQGGPPLAPLHSGGFAPAMPATLERALEVEIAAALYVLGR